MVFHAQLAHGSPTRQVRDFTNVKQLYEAIAKAFGIPTQDILYCTLNTHKVDMTRLLGGQIGLDDFLFAHVKGDQKTCTVTKSGPALGLTISDNGAGYAFIKKIRDQSIMAAAANCAVGDHIAAVNGKAVQGCRHFEVARLLKEIPVGQQFTLGLISPQASASGVAKRGAIGGSGQVKAGAGKKTLRMKKDGTAVVEDVEDDSALAMINKINDLCDQHMGIRDDELARQLRDYAKRGDVDAFATAIDDDNELQDFQFPDELLMDVHDAVHG